MKTIVLNGEISKEEKQVYIDYAKSKSTRSIETLIIKLDGEYVDLEYHYKTIPFDRIRRITGYLVGTLDRFNDGKLAEVQDRVHHDYHDFDF